MGESDHSSFEEVILVYTPIERDGELTVQFLGEAGIAARECRSATQLAEGIAEGAGGVIVSEEALEPATLRLLLQILERQPEWSDIPLIVFVREGDTIDPILTTLGTTANVTILERPVRVRTLVGAAKAALRARARQYHARELLRQLYEADKRKDEFLAILGHELRNPLAAIKTALVMLDRVGAQTPNAVKYRSSIRRQTDNLARMVEDLLDVARITAGKIELVRGPVDLNKAVESVTVALEGQAAARSQKLVVRPSASEIIVDADAVRLDQMIGNLVQNAIKYTPEGGTITISVGKEFDRAAVRVSDTGIGLEPAMLHKIFEPFVQVRSALKYAQGGLGLGLPLVRRLVELHGGQISASSPGPGLGCTFTITLPLHSSGRVGAGARSTSVIPQGRLKVLVVDDNPDIRSAMTELLRLWGHEVREAGSAAQGIGEADALRPDVALVDLGLPDANGLELARKLRERLGAQVRLVALTGYGQAEHIRDSLASGFDVHLVKPVDHEGLARVLQEVPGGDVSVH